MPRPNELKTVQSKQLTQWYHDPLSCLHTTLATVISAHGGDPLQVLGLSFGFTYIPGHVRREEFYFPGISESGLAADLAPFHDITSHWWSPKGDDLVDELYTGLKEDGLVIAAVDNFQLPHRPAFHDVHAAHLVVVDGIDEGRGTLSISDAQPPAWRGHIQLEPFCKAWNSSNPSDDQDPFFSDAEIERRCLRVQVNDPFDELLCARLTEVIRSNLDALTGPSGDHVWSGVSGADKYLDELVEQSVAGKSEPLEDLYAFAWPMQAQAFLHGELLRWAGMQSWGGPGLQQLGRAAHATASTWTNLRILGAHLHDDPAQQIPQLRRRAAQLRQSYETVGYLYGRWLDNEGATL
jgi:hypothetical protein